MIHVVKALITRSLFSRKSANGGWRRSALIRPNSKLWRPMPITSTRESSLSFYETTVSKSWVLRIFGQT